MKKRVCGVFAGIFLLLTLVACEKPVMTWQEQYDLGVRYLTEGNYEEAIIAFTVAIEIDPKNPNAYAKAAEAYEALGDTDQAEATRQRGYETTGDPSLAPRPLFTQSSYYVDFDQLDPVHQQLVERIAERFHVDDENSIFDLLWEPLYPAIVSEAPGNASETQLRTAVGDVRLELFISNQNETYYRVELREENGRAIRCSVSSNNDSNIGRCARTEVFRGDTVNWNWNGSYTGVDTQVFHDKPESSHTDYYSGTAQSGVIHGEENRRSEIADGRIMEHVYTYDCGFPVVLGPVDSDGWFPVGLNLIDGGYSYTENVDKIALPYRTFTSPDATYFLW